MNLNSFFLAALLTLVGTNLSLSRAQANEGAGQQLSFLSETDRAHLLKVREEVMASHADLKAEQNSLQQERQFMKGEGTSASTDERKTLRQNFMTHSKKMHDAMLQADPSIGPVLDQVEAKMKAQFKERAANRT